MSGRDPPDPAVGVAERAGAGETAVKITRVRATSVTVPTRADVPATGMRRSRTRRRVSELDTPWLSASPRSPLRPHPGWQPVPVPSRIETTPQDLAFLPGWDKESDT